MGTCFGRLKGGKKKHKRLYRLQHSCYRKSDDKVELHFLVEEEEIQAQELSSDETRNKNSAGTSKSKEIFQRIFAFLIPKCYKHIRGDQHSLLEVEADCVSIAGTVDCESPSCSSPVPDDVGITDSEDVQLVTLDVRSLRNISILQAQQSWRSETPPSSVDLEWESDGVVGNVRAVCQRRLFSTTEEVSTASVMDTSGSPAESLEWDSCDNIALDTDTEQLICEIERLTARALRETGGDWTNSHKQARCHCYEGFFRTLAPPLIHLGLSLHNILLGVILGSSTTSVLDTNSSLT